MDWPNHKVGTFKTTNTQQIYNSTVLFPFSVNTLNVTNSHGLRSNID